MACQDKTTNEINTPTCDSGTCVAPIGQVCLTQNCSCGCSPCQCGNAYQAAPMPYYSQACDVQETHQEVYNTQTFITALSTVSAFNMPVTGGVVGNIAVQGIQSLQVGSWLWNITYGYVKVIAFDFASGTISVENPNYPGNASPGTLIPACTMFNVVDPPSQIGDECDDPTHSFLTANFTVPIVGASLNISVSNLIGIYVNNNVQIGTGTYLVTSIIDNNTITIKNEGSGGVVGSTIYAKDTYGRCITPVTPYGDNPCDNTIQSRGALVICKNGVVTTLDPSLNGQIPVVIDALTGEVEFQSPEYPTLECTELTGCLLLVSGILTYTIQVTDTSIFEEDQLIVINYAGIEDYYWTITSILSATQMTIESVTGVQSVDASIPVTTAVCEAPCCEELDYKISNLLVPLSCNEAGTEIPIITPGMLWVGNTQQAYIENPTNRSMTVLIHVDYTALGYFHVQNADYADINFEPWFGLAVTPIGIAGVPTQNYIRQLWETLTFGYYGNMSVSPPFTYFYNWNNEHHYVVQRTISPGERLTIDAHIRFYYAYYDHGAVTALADGAFHCSGANTQIHMIGSNIY